MQKHWRLPEPVSEEFRQQFPDEHPVVLQLLWNRGLRTKEAVDVFLGPKWDRDVHLPAHFLNMGQAVQRIFLALERGEVMTVHGDYDADGVCGSAVLVSTLYDLCRRMGFDEKKITFYLPHREKEGYGLSVSTMEHLYLHEQTKLVITVDCGISNKPAIDRGKELGIDTIVCDHHTMPSVLPEQAILLHPLVPGETYPNKTLCGTGVAFKLASALIRDAHRRGLDLPDGYEKWLLDLVAIATVTDVMPLLGENRALEAFGLLVLNKTRRVGLRKLIEVAGGKSGSLDTFSIGFQIGPRLNAAGRMNHANAALHLLLEEDEERAAALARDLHQTNMARQQASDAMYQAARAVIGEPGNRRLLVAVGEGWSAGLVGLVASKLVSEFQRPVLVVGKEGDAYVGSGRSIYGFNIMAALKEAETHLDKFGGHPQACGFSTRGHDRFEKAIERMEAVARERLTDDLLVPTLALDADLSPDSVDWSLYQTLERFAPFGEQNPHPTFTARSLTVLGMDTVGNDKKHLRLTVLTSRGKLYKMIGFKMGDWLPRLKLGMKVDAVYELGVNQWNGKKELQFKMIDLRVD